MIYTCRVCKKEFTDVPAKNRRYCSKKCFFIASQKRSVGYCSSCGVRIERRNSDMRGRNLIFCDTKCMHRYQSENKFRFPQLRDRGWCEKQYSTKSLKGISELLHCGETTVYKYFVLHKIPLDRKKWLSGVPKSTEHRDKLSKARMEGKLGRGSSNGNWRGGITRLAKSIRGLKEYKRWRMEVIQASDSTCVLCGMGNAKEVDHIKKFRYILSDNKITSLDEARSCKELWDVSNGRVLCRRCNIGLETQRNCP